MAADPRLGLSEKLISAVRKESLPGMEDHPKGSHLETRAIGVLKKLHQMEGEELGSPGGAPTRRSGRPARSATGAKRPPPGRALAAGSGALRGG